MKEFTYTIKDEQGIHARPAGLLVKEVQKYESTVTIFKDEKSADARRLMALMGLGIKCGQEIRVEVSGADEDAAADGIKAFLEANL
ncbi:HPr family phosphocarrier protein [Falcatimonas sp. MSJ-15]|uniref:HPr family phosphocarrier protein n=1 Tax=Falcatimonas sp. MSJ-15 TaxID=2841515 RepID=UPI001C10E275|nr:HPr family phosphocarrier protein [Falcatimonas sp. MSJ-15]MBU5470886.1 HPr family phosphocarrier protein [Falcatimonas sp. MSJ-15]